MAAMPGIITLGATTAGNGYSTAVNLNGDIRKDRLEAFFHPSRKMSAWIGSIDRIAVAVGVGGLVQVSVAGDEAPHLRVVEPAPHQRQTRIAFTPVATRRPEPVGARAASRACHRLPERRQSQSRRDRLAGISDGVAPSRCCLLIAFMIASVAIFSSDI